MMNTQLNFLIEEMYILETEPCTIDCILLKINAESVYSVFKLTIHSNVSIQVKKDQVIVFLCKAKSRSWSRELSESGLEQYTEDETDTQGPGDGN